MKKIIKRVGLGILSLAIAAMVWLPTVHFFFSKGPVLFAGRGISSDAQKLVARQLQLWTDPILKKHELERMRGSNAEWDFMGRSFLVWSLAEMAVRDPALKKTYLPIMDEIIEETIRLENENGIYFFLMPYAKAGHFFVQPARSLFLDGEIAMMLAMRRMVEEKPGYKPLLEERVDLILERMQKNPALAAESYPDECWIFDHAVALAALKLSDYLDGTDHSEFFREWISVARNKLTHRESGLLISSYSTDGTQLDGPEGSSIWFTAHCLRLIDEEFALDQYTRARKELRREICGFAYSREWPVSWKGPMDIDSGMVIPGLEISAGGSGLAFVGAISFKDSDFTKHLYATLEFAGFPSEKNGRLKYCASNQVGDAVMLYASVLGPIWEKVKGHK
ncbi:MAG: hypothetical protein M3Y82_10975 [Verrucomicrobiota bacterium]|nr:hypothetical protein [Verrucomicrobiota bacterium]